MNRWFDRFPILSKYVSGKVILSFFILILSVMMFFIFRTSDMKLCFYPMAFSFIGDFALNFSPDIEKRPKEWFLVGGASFVVAHVFYCFAYGTKCAEKGFPAFGTGAIVMAAIMVAITIYFIVKAKETRKSGIFFLGMLYLWITSINYMVVFSYSISVKSIESLALIGGLLFLASDVIIGLEQLTGLKSKLARELVWWFYPIGQIILVIMA